MRPRARCFVKIRRIENHVQVAALTLQLGSAVMPTYLAICQPWANKRACIAGCIVGLVCAIASWLGAAQGLFGALTVDTTFEDYSMLTGNLVAIGVGAIVSLGGSLIFPDRDFSFDSIRLVGHASYQHTPSSVSAPPSPPADELEEKKGPVVDAAVLPAMDESIAPPEYDPDLEFAPLHKVRCNLIGDTDVQAYTQAKYASVALFFVLVVFIPAMVRATSSSIAR